MLSKSNTIEVTPYDSNWPKMFEAEASLFKKSIGDNCIEIHHIGSTSVPGLDAKPIIDMILVAKDPNLSIANLESIGYTYKGEMNIPFRFYFTKEDEIQVHLHMYQENNAEIDLNLIFRNFLRSNSAACKEYASLKQTLVEEQKNHEVVPMFSHYTLGKNSFITKVLTDAGFDKLRLMHCTHYAEWEAARDFRQLYFFDKVPVSDPYTWTFNHHNHMHFVLYKGTRIIGYTHLQRYGENDIILRILVIEERSRGCKLGSHLLELCQKWLKKNGFKTIYADSNSAALPFYRKHGYQNMSFDALLFH